MSAPLPRPLVRCEYRGVDPLQSGSIIKGLHKFIGKRLVKLVNAAWLDDLAVTPVFRAGFGHNYDFAFGEARRVSSDLSRECGLLVAAKSFVAFYDSKHDAFIVERGGECFGVVTLLECRPNMSRNALEIVGTSSLVASSAALPKAGQD